ncbi:hypothetical protein GF358_00430 [Candidatus Woesearchaeota archaeon]|nr:hypothetical protein [Candidatus Woesearchaeota archaeon]
MAPDVSFPVIYIKHKGNFDFNKLMKDIKSWYDENDYDFHVPKHKHKSDEEEVKISGERKITGYIKFYINVEFRIFDFKTVEVIKDGEKIKTNYGRIALEVIPGYDLDYEKRFGTTPVLKAIREFYHKYIIKRKLEDYWEDELFLQASGLIQTIKKSLEYEAM